MNILKVYSSEISSSKPIASENGIHICKALYCKQLQLSVAISAFENYNILRWLSRLLMLKHNHPFSPSEIPRCEEYNIQE